MLLCGDRNIFGGTGADANETATSNNSYGDAQHGNASPRHYGNQLPLHRAFPGLDRQDAPVPGNILLCDGSVQQISSSRLRNQLRNSGDMTQTPGPNTLLFP